jgi:uncharacterized protein YdhG (YjbR/CyaY superfamily)
MKRASSGTKKKQRPASIDAYLAAVPPNARAGLQKLRTMIHTAVPEAEEGISYGVPTFKLNGRPLAAFAAAKEHSSLFPMSAAVIRGLASELEKYATSKGTIRFPPDRPPPARLVTKILKARITELESGRP